MKIIIPSFDPSATTGGVINNPLPPNPQYYGGYGFWLMANESSFSLIIKVNADRFRLHPWELAKITFTEATQQVSWTQEVMLTNANTAPISLVLIDAYTADEKISDAFPIPLVRNTNVGGVVNTSTVETLINNGSAPNTIIIQTTPNDQATPAFQLDNEGNLTLRTLSSSVWSTILSIINGGASPATAVFHGTADVASSVAAANVASGTLGSGVALSKISSDGGKITSDGSLGNLTANAINTTGTKNNGTGNYAFSSTGPISTDNKLFATDGSGNIVTVGNILGAGGIGATSLQLAGNSAFTRRGNFNGTGGGTVATGAGGTPTWLGLTDNQSGSSSTIGAVISGSNAVVTNPSGHTWMGIAL